MEIREDLGPLRRRATLLLLAVFLTLGALHLRVAQLQLLEGEHWRQMAENNRLRRLPLPAVRGRIYDRRGNVLADNLPTWNLLLFPDEARNLDETLLFVASLGVSDAASLHQAVDRRGVDRLAPLVVGESLDWSQVSRVRAHQSDHPELSLVAGFRRHYPFGSSTAHAVGHLRLVTQAELDRDPGLDPGTRVGATGIEALADDFLAGRAGDRWVVVSAVGQLLGVVRESPSSAGRDLAVTLDAELQQVAASALGDRAGAVVALDPRNGAVRALVSSPSFDPELFSGRLSSAAWTALVDDPRHPLQDRCLQAAYPPGSTIKPFLALAALNEGLIDPDRTVVCTGSVVLHGHPFRCWQRSGHGSVDLERSLEASCDVYYYQTGQRLGIDRMARWFGTFGFGKPTGIGLPSEAPGLVGTPEWSRRVRGTPWYPGDAVSVSIGQGPVLTTATQLARGFAALANGGSLITPHVVVDPSQPAPVDLGLSPTSLARVRRGLELVVHGDYGTARRLARLPVAGKTGTAQVARLQEGVDSKDLPTHLQHHAWFVGWAPLDAPELVVAVVVEHGGGGGSVAAPTAATIFEAALAGGTGG
ncbi:MAG: penicillin-binding protein 2 [Thermoanaerobaculales bacterium]|nr:penicillin-binding protein 2 [Thermoanaerobaculales bacterium]